MQTGTIVMMVVVLGILWGGFGTLLVVSKKADGRRNRAAGNDAGD